MNTATYWAQENRTKSEGSSAICGPRTWKSVGSIDPLDPLAPRPNVATKVGGFGGCHVARSLAYGHYGAERTDMKM